MKVMILAAGRGERMRPLTDNCPKPLLSIGEDTLISRHIKQLKNSGFKEFVINHAWLGEQIESFLNKGESLGVRIQYSPEGATGLETAGGIATALPLLGNQPFLVINGDIYTDMDFSCINGYIDQINESRKLAHLWLVNNPIHNLQGDFSLDEESYLVEKNQKTFTFSGIGIYHPKFFDGIAAKTPQKLLPIIKKHMKNKKITASILKDNWLDVGTPERLEEAKNWAILNQRNTQKDD